MEKVDVAIQSYKKPESLIYTLLSLKKYCGDYIDTVYIDDDCSGDNIVQFYLDNRLAERLLPIKLKVRVNHKAGKYTYTLMTNKIFKKKTLKEKIQLLGHLFIHRLRWMSTEDDIRYQWAINQTNKRFLFIIHDDIKFYDNIVKLYYSVLNSDDSIAIVGDLGGLKFCPYGPCGESGHCSPEKIINGIYPCNDWPKMGAKSLFHKMMGRYRRNCRINEWCCMINVDIARKMVCNYGICFGNYEGGGDVGCYWFDKIIELGYKFYDPLPNFEDRRRWYLHWWQGHEGHNVWVKYDGTKVDYKRDFIIECIRKEFNYEVDK